MRRLSLMLVLVAALAACSSGSNNVASSTTTTPPAASPTSAPAPATVAPTSAPPAADSAGGGATDYCKAFAELEKAKGAANPAAVGTGFQAAAADMRKFAPSEIKDAAGTYANLMETIGKAAQTGTMDEASLSKAIAQGIAGKAADIGKVAVWVATNCKLP